MAEGFLRPDGDEDMESVGDKFINVLLHNSLLQASLRDDYGNVEGCVMHDLVHDLACSVLGNEGDMERVRYLISEESSSVPKGVAKYLRTLIFKGNISRNMFSDYECLHVLTLDSFGLKELPSQIRELIHLRNLDISYTRIEYLPDWIGELCHLQTFTAEKGFLKKMPSTTKYLINLRHLHIFSDVDLPAEIGRLTSLQTLTHFRVGDQNGCTIEELGSLNNLKGEIQIDGLEMVRDKEDAERANLFRKAKLIDLCLRWDIYASREEGVINDENVLEGLQPHSNLKKLSIVGFKGKRFASWTLKMAVQDVPRGSWIELSKLMSVTLSDCQECEEIPMFGHLPNLKSLWLQRLSNVKSITSSFYGLGIGLVKNETRIAFPALEHLKMFAMPKLTEWAEVEDAGSSEVNVFPLLEHFHIYDCQKLMSFPIHFSSRLKNLRITRAGRCTPLANIFPTKLAFLRNLCLTELHDLESLPDWLFCNNPNLLEVEISKCKDLRELPKGLSSLILLAKLTIRECPNLILIGGGGDQSEGSLRHLEIRKCDALAHFPCELVGSSLEQVKLVSLKSLENLPSVIDSLAKSPRLTELRIEGVPQFKASSEHENWPFRSLQELAIDASSGSGSGSMETIDGILQGCSDSLHNLTLIGMESWESLPESMQHLSTCTFLFLDNFGMEELPEWFGNFSSLKSLFIYNCKKLRRLPSSMSALSGLQRLIINGCPELHLQQQSDADDSQWPKISHIPNITIDGSNCNAVNPQESKTRKQLCLSCLKN
ncbi:disease resistance protein RGA2-like [Salvia miltiorrhiza]|uniref:disease resistance protein RGA2-like n=1 Tax=Salvia miltiorrhiza TaxID=226208 RepID=UPI0025ACB61D|nr:disease resistance protein RGA2-like [Salvia miltiorrhiza]